MAITNQKNAPIVNESVAAAKTVLEDLTARQLKLVERLKTGDLSAAKKVGPLESDMVQMKRILDRLEKSYY